MKEREMVGERLQSNCIRKGIFVSSKVWRVKKNSLCWLQDYARVNKVPTRSIFFKGL